MDLSANTDLAWLAELISDATAATPATDFLLVGAVARDLLLHYGHGARITRATTDVDLGVAVSGWQEFQELQEALWNSARFQPGRPEGHRFIHRSGTPLDLVPYGGIERDDGTIVWPEDATVMGVLGYREARRTAVEILLPQEQSVATVCLPILAILKLIAWSERHLDAPRKDASDLFLILSHYLNDENSKRLYDVGAHLLEENNFDYDVAGAWLAGYDAARHILDCDAGSNRVLDAVDRILEIETKAEGALRLVSEVTAPAEALKQLAGFYEGLTYLRHHQAN